MNNYYCYYNFLIHTILLYKNKSPWIYPRALLPAIVHDYFLNRGVPGSADMIPSASEPVLFPTSIIHNLRKKSTGKLCKNRFFSCSGLFLGIRFFLVIGNLLYVSDIEMSIANMQSFFYVIRWI